MMDGQIRYNRFDQVKILTTKNVKYLSALPGSKIEPKGVWQVSGAVAGELLLVKNNAVIRIPPSDVLKIIEYDITSMTGKFGRFMDGIRHEQEQPGQDKEPN
jgi:hypothetical protein